MRVGEAEGRLSLVEEEEEENENIWPMPLVALVTTFVYS